MMTNSIYLFLIITLIKDIAITQIDKEILFDMGNCDDTNIKQVGVQNLKIKYLIVKDGTKWLPN